MNTPEPTIQQNKLNELADHLQAASKLLRELANEYVLPLSEDQEWYWTEEWQVSEKEADKAEQSGEFKDFDKLEDALDFLHWQV